MPESESVPRELPANPVELSTWIIEEVLRDYVSRPDRYEGAFARALGKLLAERASGASETGKIELAPSSTTANEYDENGNMISSKTTDAQTTEYYYDPRGRLISEVTGKIELAPSSTTAYEYDENGNMISSKTTDAQTTEHYYDSSGRLTSEVRDESIREYDYSNLGEVSVTSKTPTESGYHATGQTEFERNPAVNPIIVVRDTNGKIITLSGSSSLVEEGEQQDRNVARRLISTGLPADYDECYAVLTEINHQFRTELAIALEPRLNERIATMAHDSYSDKQRIASWANRQLRELGLAVKCPKTGKPAILVADVQGREGGPSRFRLEVREESGRKVRTFSSRHIPTLQLREDLLREEPLATFAERTRKGKEHRDR